MLTKEFAQRVELSEKQVRKIVQPLKKMTSNYLQISLTKLNKRIVMI